MNAHPDLFDYAQQARDAALERVAAKSGPWMDRARRAIAVNLSEGWEGTAEDLRLLLTERGLPMPHHHNAWGALIKTVIPHLLTPTGRRRNMRTKKSHARETPVYRRSNGDAAHYGRDPKGKV